MVDFGVDFGVLAYGFLVLELLVLGGEGGVGAFLGDFVVDFLGVVVLDFLDLLLDATEQMDMDEAVDWVVLLSLTRSER